jgi:hypothetical protein
MTRDVASQHGQVKPRKRVARVYSCIGVQRIKYRRDESVRQRNIPDPSGNHILDGQTRSDHHRFRRAMETYESGHGLIVWNHVAGNPLSPGVRTRV